MYVAVQVGRVPVPGGARPREHALEHHARGAARRVPGHRATATDRTAAQTAARSQRSVSARLPQCHSRQCRHARCGHSNSRADQSRPRCCCHSFCCGCGSCEPDRDCQQREQSAQRRARHAARHLNLNSSALHSTHFLFFRLILPYSLLLFAASQCNMQFVPLLLQVKLFPSFLLLIRNSAYIPFS